MSEKFINRVLYTLITILVALMALLIMNSCTNVHQKVAGLHHIFDVDTITFEKHEFIYFKENEDEAGTVVHSPACIECYRLYD